MVEQSQWQEEAEVVMVGYGGAGAVAAITAHDAGAKVLVLEKETQDTPSRTNHTPSTRMAAGAWFCPTEYDGAVAYLKGLLKISNEPLGAEQKEIIPVFARYLMENTAWLKNIGMEAAINRGTGQIFEIGDQGKVFAPDFPDLPGANTATFSMPTPSGKYRGGAALWKQLSQAVASRKIPVLWGTPGVRLITEGGAVRGVVAKQGNREMRVRASRAVILTSGGFEFNEWMKLNYLRAYPAYFTGNPGNTGDGIAMAMDVGASLWHMNNAAWRVVMKFPEFPCAFSTQNHETASIFVDKRGNRFTNERFRLHSFGYELTAYDCYAMAYPRIPCYWIFDEKRRKLAPLASYNGNCNPPGEVPGDIYYKWDEDNKKEIDRGWILKSSTIEGLAKQIAADADSSGLFSQTSLLATVKRYNEFCHKGEDVDFHKPLEWLRPLEDPPYYAVKLWPGGPNTQGGPQRNALAQVLRVNGKAIPRLYAAGELGSVFSMLYQGAGNIGECIAFGRIAGSNAAAEKPWQ